MEGCDGFVDVRSFDKVLWMIENRSRESKM